MALGITAGDEVVVPAFTFGATAEISGKGWGKAGFADVDPDTFNLTADLISEKLTPKTRGVVLYICLARWSI